jgi:hypothetical protein
MKIQNKNLEVLIKIRHLSDGLNSNWEMLNTSRNKATQMLDEANSIMQMYGTEIGKSNFINDYEKMAALKEKIATHLLAFKEMINTHSSGNSKEMYREFQANTEELSSIFAKIGKYPDHCFNGINSADWFNIWAVIQSNIYVVQGIGHSAFIQLQLLTSFNKQEIDDLTQEIIKYVPESFTLEDAIKYKNDYIMALDQMKEEANKKDNLWDRFLNFLAGNMPFKQSPQERVMMMRWLDGERGEL